MKKNILITTQKVDTVDPILNFFLDWIREFSKHYETVYVVCLQKGVYELPPNVVVLSLGKEEGQSRFGYIARFYRHVVPLIVGGKISKIFVHMNEIYVFLLIPLLPLRIIKNIPLIWWKTQAKVTHFAFFMRHFVTRVFTASEHGFKVNSSKRVITGHGINTEYFVLPKSARTEGKVRMVAIGRPVPVKHYEDIINAAAHLVKTTTNFSIAFVGVRTDEKNEYVDMLEAQIDALGLREYITLEPPVPFSEMVSVYHQADVVINTTYPNTFDKVLLEAMSCGVIPVTPTPSYEAIVGPYNLFPKDRSPEALAEVLARICLLTASDRAALGIEMRKEIVERHNVVKLIDRISTF